MWSGGNFSAKDSKKISVISQIDFPYYHEHYLEVTFSLVLLDIVPKIFYILNEFIYTESLTMTIGCSCIYLITCISELFLWISHI
jgi:hypothetical protein